MVDENEPVVDEFSAVDETPVSEEALPVDTVAEPSTDPESEFPEVLPDPEFEEPSAYVPPEPYRFTSPKHVWMITALEDGRLQAKPWSFNGEIRIVGSVKELP
jgi:hypothetical protein